MSETPPTLTTHEIDFKEIKRTPILLTNHTVMLIQLFHAPHNNLSDMWTWDYIDVQSEQEAAARQLIAQLKDHWTVAFLQALQRAIIAMLRENDEEFGTKFADEDARVQI